MKEGEVMNVKRYIVIVLVLLTLFVGITKAYAKVNDWGEEVPGDKYNAKTDEENLSSYTPISCSNNDGSCFKGLGLRLKLIMYDKKVSDTEELVSTIYIINPNMLIT
jgi:hypothetical protein